MCKQWVRMFIVNIPDRYIMYLTYSRKSVSFSLELIMWPQMHTTNGVRRHIVDMLSVCIDATVCLWLFSLIPAWSKTIFVVVRGTVYQTIMEWSCCCRGHLFHLFVDICGYMFFVIKQQHGRMVFFFQNA